LSNEPRAYKKEKNIHYNFLLLVITEL